MPRGNGMGPPSGSGSGTGQGIGRGEAGRGRMRGTRAGAGPQGDCICPNCGATASHQVGTPCYNLSCPKCGTKMIRG